MLGKDHRTHGCTNVPCAGKCHKWSMRGNVLLPNPKLRRYPAPLCESNTKGPNSIAFGKAPRRETRVSQVG